MSTVVWDGKTLAADRQATANGGRREVSKARQLPNGEIIAVTGGLGEGLILMQWYEDGADLAKYPTFQTDKEDWCRLVVVKIDGSVLEYERRPVAMTFPDKYKAWGSGQDYALGALAMGADSVKAVAVAALFDISSGMGVDAFTLPNL